MDDLSYLQLLLETRWAVLTSAHYILLILTLIEVRNNQTAKTGLESVTHSCEIVYHWTVLLSSLQLSAYNLGFEIHT